MKQKLQLELIKKLLKKEGEEGFSLLELVVIIAVLALLAAIGLPQLKDVLNGARLSAAKMSLSECRKQCELNPDEPLALTPINGVVYESTRDCNSEVRAVIDGLDQECDTILAEQRGLPAPLVRIRFPEWVSSFNSKSLIDVKNWHI